MSPSTTLFMLMFNEEGHAVFPSEVAFFDTMLGDAPDKAIVGLDVIADLEFMFHGL